MAEGRDGGLPLQKQMTQGTRMKMVWRRLHWRREGMLLTTGQKNGRAGDDGRRLRWELAGPVVVQSAG